MNPASVPLKPVPSPARKTRRTALWLVCSLLVIILAALPCLSLYVGWSLTHPKRALITADPSSVGLSFEPIAFPSREDGLSMKGWFLPANGDSSRNATVIIAHGYKGNRLQVDVPGLPLSKSLVQSGFNVVMFDFRNSGESEGKLTSVGQYETRDLLGAIDWVHANHPGKIALLGFSMGATVSLLAAEREPSVAAVIADSPFSELKGYLEANLDVWSHLPKVPFTPLILSLLPPIIGVDPNEANAFRDLNKLQDRSVLFIHSDTDNLIPYTESERMWSQNKERFTFWRTTGAGHVGTYKQNPERYVSKVVPFLTDALK